MEQSGWCQACCFSRSCYAAANSTRINASPYFPNAICLILRIPPVTGQRYGVPRRGDALAARGVVAEGGPGGGQVEGYKILSVSR